MWFDTVAVGERERDRAREATDVAVGMNPIRRSILQERKNRERDREREREKFDSISNSNHHLSFPSRR